MLDARGGNNREAVEYLIWGFDVFARFGKWALVRVRSARSDACGCLGSLQHIQAIHLMGIMGTSLKMHGDKNKYIIHVIFSAFDH